jgi:hypothetical protein
MIVERAVEVMLELARRHQGLHADLQSKLNALDPTGQHQFTGAQMLGALGSKIFIELDDALDALRQRLPETRDSVLEVGKQLRSTLRMQLPTRRFVSMVPTQRERELHPVPGLPKPAIWRRVVRWMADRLSRMWRGTPTLPKARAEPQAPEIKRFPPRSYAPE